MDSDRDRAGAAELAAAMVRAGKQEWEIAFAIRQARLYGVLSLMVDGGHPETVAEVQARRPYVYRAACPDKEEAERERTRLDRQWAYSDDATDWVRRHHGRKRVATWQRQRDEQPVPEPVPAIMPVDELRKRYKERDRAALAARRQSQDAGRASETEIASPSPLGQPAPTVVPEANGHKLPLGRCRRCGYNYNSIGHVVVCDDD